MFVAWLFARRGRQISGWLAARPLFANGGGDALLLALLLLMGSLLQWVLKVGYWQTETREYFRWHVFEGLGWAGPPRCCCCSWCR